MLAIRAALGARKELLTIFLQGSESQPRPLEQQIEQQENFLRHWNGQHIT